MATMEKVIDIGLHGLACRLEADHPPFQEFVRRFLGNLFLEPARQGQVGSRPELLSRLHWNKQYPIMDGAETRVWGRRLAQVGDKILLRELAPMPGLQLAVEWGERGLQIEAYYQPQGRLSFLSRHLFPEAAARTYAALVYYLLYFPIMALLETGRGWHVLHAAAVDFPRGACLLAGLPGSGKSTLAAAALGNPQARLLSDNLIFLDEEMLSLYACPEPVHLSAASLGLLPPSARGRLSESFQKVAHGRDSFVPRAETQAQTGQLAAIFLVGLTGQGSSLENRLLPPDSAARRLLAVDRLAKETIAYADFAASLELAVFASEQKDDKFAALSSLCSRVPCYELWIPRHADLASVLGEMYTLCERNQSMPARLHRRQAVQEPDRMDGALS